MRRLFGLTVLALFLSGCFTVRYQTRLPEGGEKHDVWHHYFLFGLVGRNEVDVDAVCPRGVHAVTQYSPLWSAITVVTFGLYAPRVVEVECAGKAAAQ